MKLSSKFLAVALSALFAATPNVSISAMPLSGVKVQPVETDADPLLVQYNCELRRTCSRTNPRYDPSDNSTGSYNNYYDNYDARSYRRYRDGSYGNYRNHRAYRHYRHRDRGDAWLPLATFGMGAIIGGAIANDRVYRGGGGSHVNWCANRYRSYRAYDNTYQPYGGPRRQCYSPYR